MAIWMAFERMLEQATHLVVALMKLEEFSQDDFERASRRLVRSFNSW